MACPFRKLWQGDNHTATTSGCPFRTLSVSANVDYQKRTEDETSVDERLNGQECPVLRTTEQSGTGRQCPYGFSNTRGPKLSDMHCVLCRSLLFECVSLNCKHIFCGACIERFSMCPMCGEDIVSTTANSEVQAVVDAFIEAHSGTLSVLEADPKRDQEGQMPKLEDTKATFYLHLGLRSLSGGNLRAAACRIHKSKVQLQSRSRENSAEADCQLGCVSGQEGDCHRLMGNMEEAQQCYLESIAYLQKSKEHNCEVLHALSVTLNKLGDLCYSQNQLSAARTNYQESLDVRRKLYAQCLNSRREQQAELDIGVSLVKLADVHKELGEEVQCNLLLKEAQVLAGKLASNLSTDDPVIKAKFDSFSAALQSLLS